MNAIIAYPSAEHRHELHNALAKAGYHVVAEVDSVARLRESLQAHTPGLLVTAWQLADGAPLGTRSDADVLRNWAILVLGEKADLDFWRRARAAGAHAVAVFPGASAEQLQARAEAAVKAHQAAAAVPRPPQPARPQPQRAQDTPDPVQPGRVVEDSEPSAAVTIQAPTVEGLRVRVLGKPRKANGRTREREQATPRKSARKPASNGVLPTRGLDTAFSGVMAWIGALPRCGTTTALSAWALAQAEAGSRIVAVDANADRPALSVVLCGGSTLQGWETAWNSSPDRLRRFLQPVPGQDELKVLPMGWMPGRTFAPEDIVARLASALSAAQSTGAAAIAVDLGSFHPLRDGVPDPRVRWAAQSADAVVVVAPFDAWGVDAAARMVVALERCGARLVTLVLTEGATDDDARAVARALENMSPPARVQAAVAMPWQPEAVRPRIGNGTPPVRLASVLAPAHARRGPAFGPENGTI